MALHLVRCTYLSASKINPIVNIFHSVYFICFHLICVCINLNILQVRYSHHAAHKFSHAIQSTQLADLTELNNGLRVVTERTNSLTTTVGVWVEAGSRNETKELNGITNFIEHLLFKGSRSRSKRQLENDVYGLGAVLNTFSNRESNGFFATVAPTDALKAIELLSDLIQRPTLKSEDIEETRNDILKELDACENNYEQVVMDYLHSVAYQETSLAFSKYGPTQNIKQFSQKEIEKGLDLIFKGPRMVIAASGDVNHDQM